MANPINITLAQLNPTVGDIAGNGKKLLETWKEADSKTDLVVFPELYLSGYPPEDLVTKPSFLNAVEETIENICSQSKSFKSASIVPTPYRAQGKIYNAAHLIEGGKIIATVQKYHLPNYGVFDEMRVFSSAPLPEPLQFRGATIGLMICEDMWFPNVAAHLKSRGAEILIIPNGSPFDADKSQGRFYHARNRIAETKLPLLYLNQIGGQDEIVFDGASFAMNAYGEVVLEMPAFQEDIATISFPNLPKPVKIQTEEGQREKEIYNALVLGLRDYIRKNNFCGIVLGLSGGIDSALSAVIAADAIGPENVQALMLPSQYTSRESVEDAAVLAKNIGVALNTISIEEPVRTVKEALHPILKTASGITLENIQPRVRGILLMALSNASGKMLLTTGNKSEMAVGYATLYGDMCGGFNVLKDVYKTEVYKLARWRNHDNIIPERIFTKAPTAELKPNQTDQDTLPPYDMLDSILQGLIERDEGIEDLIKQGYDRPTIVKIWKMLSGAEFKRRQSAPGVKITSKAFGRDRRYPITNRFINIVEKQ